MIEEYHGDEIASLLNRRTGETGAEEADLFVPRYAEEDEPCVICWSCHGYLIGPVGRRLCRCHEPAPLPPRLAEKARVLEALRDALAERYQRRWFRILVPDLRGADEDEARAVWSGLWPAARKHAARRLEERGMRL